MKRIQMLLAPNPGGAWLGSVLLVLASLPALVGAEPLRVFTSVLPLKTFVEKVGGPHVEVRAMVQAGYDPHTYEPTPQQIVGLTEAVLYVGAGMPFEDAWMARIRSANPDMQILDVGGDAREHGHGDEGHTHAGEADPHVWTSPRLAQQMAGLIRDRLSALDPRNGADYAAHHDAFVAELEALDRDIRGLLDPLVHRRFMVFHPAWGYFAEAYGLVQVPIEHEGKEPGARTLAAIIEKARQDKVRVVFVQPQFDRRSATQVARAIDGAVIAVDPLAADYTENLREVARQFAGALRP